MNITAIKGWKGSVSVNGTEYSNYSEIPADLTFSTGVRILLSPAKKSTVTGEKQPSDRQPVTAATGNNQYRVTVRAYMTKKATADFDFMEKWNNNNPMPLRTMVGEIVKETRGMQYMVLHGDITGERVCRCMKCGRVITNPVSQYFGLGVECGGHNYVNPFSTDEELKAAVAEYKAKLNKITWEGWIIKSAIEEMEVIA